MISPKILEIERSILALSIEEQPRVVIDTSVFISAFLTSKIMVRDNGMCAHCPYSNQLFLCYKYPTQKIKNFYQFEYS